MYCIFSRGNCYTNTWRTLDVDETYFKLHRSQTWKSCGIGWMSDCIIRRSRWYLQNKSSDKPPLISTPISPCSLTTIMFYTRISRFMWISLHGYGNQTRIWKIIFLQISVHIHLLRLLLVSFFHSLKLHHSNAIRNLVDGHVPGQEADMRCCIILITVHIERPPRPYKILVNSQ